jgi:hypothetical protein
MGWKVGARLQGGHVRGERDPLIEITAIGRQNVLAADLIVKSDFLSNAAGLACPIEYGDEGPWTFDCRDWEKVCG